MLHIDMRKAASAKPAAVSVKEEEQLYLVRKSSDAATQTAKGFRHYRKPDRQSEHHIPIVSHISEIQLSYPDNQRGAVNKLLAANAYYRSCPWPRPFDSTEHMLHLGDARDLSWIGDESIHLVVTSPPYWTLKT